MNSYNLAMSTKGEKTDFKAVGLQTLVGREGDTFRELGVVQDG